MMRVRDLAIIVAVGAGLSGGLAAAQPKFASDEYLILGDTNRGAGEPMVAVNPKDPKTIIVVGMSTWNAINGQTPPPPGAPAPPGAGGRNAALMAGLRTPNSTVMSMAVTHDGGVTWKHSEDPIRHGTHSRCADPVAAAGPDGALYVGCINREPVGEFLATDAMSVSKDGGETWSAPMMLIGNDQPYNPAYAPGLNPIHSETISSPFDRPWIVIDQSNNTVVMFAAHGQTGEPARTQSYFTSTKDDGKTWSLIYAIDSAQYPQSGGGDFAAARGVLAAAYIASKAPGGEPCPCVVFGTSTNGGKSFDYHSVTSIKAPAAGGPGGAKLVADPSRSGHFAMMITSPDRTTLFVTETEDGGKTWSAPANAGAVPGSTAVKSWIDFSPTGMLATVWRGIHADGSYDVYSTLSRDGGKSFSAPLKVSHASSPPTNPVRGNYMFGDDISDVVVDGDTVHMVWGDSRAGFQGTWYGRVPIAAY